MNNLSIVYEKIDKIRPNEYNPKKMTKDEYQQLRSSIEKFGIVDPLIVNSAPGREGVLIGGHQRYKVYQDIGIKEVPVVYINIPDIERERELCVRLSKNTGSWDYDLLANFDEVVLADIGFNSEELDKIFDLGIKEDDYDAGVEYEKIIKPITQRGDLYRLGNHRLMCGDSTIKEDVEKLMGGEKADMVFTDPPYNVGYDYWGVRGTREKGTVSDKVFNDKKKPEEYQHFIKNSFQNAFIFSKDYSSVYCWHGVKSEVDVKLGLIDSGWYISQTIIWLKNSIILSKGQDYHRIYEPCYYGWKKGKKHYVNKKAGSKWDEIILLDREDYMDYFDVLYEYRDSIVDYKHPTQKPARLAERALKKHSKRDNIVLDLFGGSGSTLIACEQLNRRCFMMELDPKFCDVIINRWETFTGKKAVKLNA